MTKIAIPTTGNDLNSLINEQFGRAEQFLLVSIPEQTVTVWNNPFQDGHGGVGAKVSSALIKQSVEVAFVDSLGPNARSVLEKSGVSILHGRQESVSMLLDKYQRGEMEQC
jgi:predicted Fe-Mo cluster-binding NifX family protein